MRPTDPAPIARRASRMHPGVVTVALVVAALVGGGSDLLAAQVAWDAPRALGPDSPVDLGLAWVRFGDAPGGDGVVGVWRPPSFPPAVSLRAGAARDAEDDPVALGGVDVRVPLARRDRGAVADVAWSTGAGLAVGGFTRVSLPVDLALGRAWSSGSVWIAPWVGAGLAMDLDLGDEAPAEEFRVRPGAGAGVDLALDPDRRLVLRGAVAFGDRKALSLGAVLRPPH